MIFKQSMYETMFRITWHRDNQDVAIKIKTLVPNIKIKAKTEN